MNTITVSENTTIEILSPEDKAEALAIALELDDLAADSKGKEADLNSNWVRTGILVNKVRSKKYWLGYGHSNFGNYIGSLETKFRKKKSHIHLCWSIADKLLPYIASEDLTAMGISRANEIKKMLAAGKPINQDVVEAALDPEKDLDEFRGEVALVIHGTPPENGKWFDFGGFYVTPEEKSLVDEAYKLALQIDPVIPHDIPEHVQRKEVMIRLCQEFLGTYFVRS